MSISCLNTDISRFKNVTIFYDKKIVGSSILYVCGRVLVRKYGHVCACLCVLIRMRVHMRLCVGLREHVRLGMRTPFTHTYMQIHTHLYTQTHIHAQVDALVHTRTSYTCARTCTHRYSHLHNVLKRTTSSW